MSTVYFDNGEQFGSLYDEWLEGDSHLDFDKFVQEHGYESCRYDDNKHVWVMDEKDATLLILRWA